MQPRTHLGSEPARWPLQPVRRFELPAPPSPLIGREHDCDVATDLLLNQPTRLLTLVGPPGVGKTRLALAIAENARDQFEHGTVFVDLSPVREPNLVLATIAQSFGLRQQGTLSPAEQLHSYLEEMSVLLVLDNFEHLVEAATHISQLLARARRVVVVATSRASLRLRAERVFEVAPLAPEASLAMFVERARALRPDFVCAERDVPILNAICARVDGLPLAIELAAARTVLLSPAEILDRLSRRLVLLTDAPRDASTRHRTLRDAIDWSYELLSGDEQALLRRLSVFVGGFTADGAEVVFGATQETTFDCLTSLVRMSLVRLEPTSDDVPETRFRLLETVREYAWEQAIAAGEADASQLGQAAYWRDFVEQHYPLNFGAEVGAYHLRLERELANLRQALGSSLDSGHVEIALRLAAGLHWFWYGRGYLVEGLRWLTTALSQASAEPAAARAVAARAAGAMALNLGQFADALDWLELAVSLGSQRGDDAAARAELAMALGIRGVAQIAAGQYASAEASIRQSLAIFEALADEWGIATAREVLGAIAALQGDAEKAEALASEALEVHRRLGGRENIARALDVLGYASALRGELANAETCFEESLGLRRSVPNRPATAAVLARLGLVAYLGRNWQRAATYYRESLALAQEVGDAAAVVRCLGQVAALGLACSIDRGTIARLGTAVRQHQTALRLPSPPVEQVAARKLASVLRSEISPVGLAAAWLGGRGMDLEQAARLGFGVLDEILRRNEVRPTIGAELQRLSPRETQVAALIAQGLTNRQIAEDLVVAQRTVDTHVERILAKLGFNTRAQIAAWAVMHGVLTPPTNQ